MDRDKDKKEARKEKDLDKLIGQINKEFGAGALMRLNAEKRQEISSVEAIPTGCFAIDRITGVGGFARGKIYELYGGESSGKTTILLQAIATAQRLGNICAFIDAEQALDIEYAKDLGVDFDSLLLQQPESGEQALGIAERLIESKQVDVIVVDSVASLVPQKELDNPMDKETMGSQARLMGKSLRKIRAKMKGQKTVLAFINQTRAKFGVMFGDKEDTPGGKALKFAADVRIKLSMMGAVKERGEKIANRTKAYTKKNKLSAPHKTGEFTIVYGKGVDKNLDLWENLLITEIATTKSKNGIKRVYINEEKFNDYEDFVDRLNEEKGFRKMMKKLLRAQLMRS